MIRPSFDEATKHSFNFAEEIVEYLKEGMFDYLDLPKQDAIKDNSVQVMKQFPTANIIHYDHGSENAIIGNDGEPIIDLTNNSLLKGRECYNMNCLSAKGLGADSYRRYGTIYWGSWKVIAFTTDVVDDFQRAFNFGIIQRLNDEEDWNKILEMTIENDDKIIDEFMVQGKLFAAAIHRENRDARRVWTGKTPPPPKDSDCIFRSIALKLLGQKGWRIPKPFP